jgi:ribosome maturation factor RimP
MTEQSTQKHTQHGVDLAKIREAIAPVLSAHGISLVDLEWSTDRSGWVLRVTIEREGSTDQGGGVTLEDCADVSRDVSSVLDVEDLIAAHYNLEVSSPGLDRPLRTEAEFARFSGALARVKLSRPAPDGQRLLRGTLAEAPAGQVAVVVDGKRIEVPFADVAEANLVFELSPQPKKKAKPGGRKSAGGGKPSESRSGRERPQTSARQSRPKSS